MGLEHLADPGGYPTLGVEKISNFRMSVFRVRVRRERRVGVEVNAWGRYIYFMGLRGIASGSVGA